MDLTALTQRSARLVFCSSTSAAAHSSDAGHTIYERLREHESAAAPLGYARAKWVAEHLCQSAHATTLRGRVAVARLGQLCGGTDDGRWNESEALPLLLASAKYAGCLPLLDGEVRVCALRCAPLLMQRLDRRCRCCRMTLRRACSSTSPTSRSP